MTLPLIKARKKPKFGFPCLALLLGITSACFAFIGIQSVTATPGAQLQVIVEGTQPLNITQETVDQSLGGPVSTWKPIRILVTDRQLSLREREGLEDPGADVILSTAIENGTLDLAPNRSVTGAGIYLPGSNIRSLDVKARQIGYTYRDNVGLGHGPKAVAAAALYAVEVLDSGPIRSLCSGWREQPSGSDLLLAPWRSHFHDGAGGSTFTAA